MDAPVFYTLKNELAYVKIKVFPSAGENRITGIKNGELQVRIKAQPERGKANKALVQFIAKLLRISASSVLLHAGETSHHKTIIVPAQYIHALLGISSQS